MLNKGSKGTSLLFGRRLTMEIERFHAALSEYSKRLLSMSRRIIGDRRPLWASFSRRSVGYCCSFFFICSAHLSPFFFFFFFLVCVAKNIGDLFFCVSRSAVHFFFSSVFFLFFSKDAKAANGGPSDPIKKRRPCTSFQGHKKIGENTHTTALFRRIRRT